MGHLDSRNLDVSLGGILRGIHLVHRREAHRADVVAFAPAVGVLLAICRLDYVDFVASDEASDYVFGV